jgi:hypothetical protein
MSTSYDDTEFDVLVAIAIACRQTYTYDERKAVQAIDYAVEAGLVSAGEHSEATSPSGRWSQAKTAADRRMGWGAPALPSA